MIQAEVTRRRRRRSKRSPDIAPRVLAYVRVSTEEQSLSGAGLGAQRDAIARETEARGWSDVRYIEDAGHSAKSLNRPGIQEALGLLATGDANVLVVSKLDRLSRSLLDFAALMEQSERDGWSLVALDLGVDTTTPQGEVLAGVLALFAQFERRLIGERTKAGLAVKRAQGVRLGRPIEIPDDVRGRIVSERQAGATYAAIAERLTADAVPTARGGSRWYASSVHAALRAQ
jgi:DNA invertase Pin-like site-specific DNA recombinase